MSQLPDDVVEFLEIATIWLLSFLTLIYFCHFSCVISENYAICDTFYMHAT
jgi:hypothetical protein